METTVVKKQTAFRFNEELMKKIKREAKRENRSVNNFVETILSNVLNREPNEETLAAMREVESGVELETLDMNNFRKYVKAL